MLSNKEKKILQKQLNAIEGQIKAIEKMLNTDREAEEIYVQFKAVKGIVDKALYTILDDLLRKNFAQTLVKAIDTCPGECDNCDRLELMKKQFGKLDLKEVLKQLSKLNTKKS
jgi:CsoR family transcriptional regulator, copper-sensing transcriptional repressor